MIKPNISKTAAAVATPRRQPLLASAPLTHLRLTSTTRGARHVMMRFKEGDRDGGQQDDQAVTPNTPSPDSNPPTTHQHHQGHVDAIARSRAALNKLLGREPHSAGADTAAAPANKPVSVQPRRVPAFEAPLNVPVYSRRREVLVGRVAMAAFYASCQWEVLTGLGPLSQLSVTTGLPRIAVQLLLGAFVLHGLYGFSPSTPTWSAQNRNDLLRRPRGVPRVFVNPFTQPARFLGYSEWGFTKANEVFAGRLAMLGWAGVAAVEPFAGGKGAIGQIAWWLHLPAVQPYYQFSGLLLLVLPVAFGALAYINKRPGQVSGGDDIY